MSTPLQGQAVTLPVTRRGVTRQQIVLSVGDAASVLGMSAEAVRRLIADGALKAWRDADGSLWRIAARDIVAYTDARGQVAS